MLLACLGLVVQWAVPVRPGSFRFLLVFLLPVFLAAWRGGFGAGLLATALGIAGSYGLWKKFGWLNTLQVGVLFSFVFGRWSLSRKGIRLGWITRRKRGETAFWHNGGTGGYRSFMAFIADNQTAVVVLSNTANSVDSLGWRILKVLATNDGRLATGKKTVALAGKKP